MKHTVEDAIEILAGIRPRIINIRIDHNEKTLIKSIGKQTASGLALTDRQLDLSLKKIKKYKENLEKNNIDVDTVLLTTPLRFPLREIDRSQTISVGVNDHNKPVIFVKSPRSKNFSEKWQKIQDLLIGECHEHGTVKEVPLNETNAMTVVSNFQNLDFDISDDLMEIYREIEKILENPTNFAPYLDLENDQVILKNANKNCIAHVDTVIPEETKNNFLQYIASLKNCGFYHKDHKIVEKIEKLSPSELVTNVLVNTATRFRLNPEQHSAEKLVELIDAVGQWPILVLVDDDHKAYEQVTEIYNQAVKKISSQDITVFFRVDNGQKNSQEFAQFVKDNHLNNYIGSNTKVVFIAKNKIPKPLLKADWKPVTAVMMSNHDFGKTSAFLDDMSVVYYYNKSVVVRHNRIKGARQIAQL